MVLRQYRYAAIAVAAALIVIGAVAVGRHGDGPSTASQLDANGLPKSPVSYDYAKSRPEAQLHYPGATVFRTIGSGEQHFAGQSDSSAFAGAILTTDASPDAIYAWYDEQLTKRNWKPFDIGTGGAEKSVKGYQRGPRERFNVGIDDPKLLGDVLGRPVPAGTTIFEISYLIFPSS